MKLYNTMSRKKEEFAPLTGGVVRMYSCGPTVYNYAHIGNLRTYIFTDLIRRVLHYEGYKIKGVMNITDVGHLLSDADEGEDKMVTASKSQQKTPREIADYYTGVFLSDLKKLNIEIPEIVPKATDHISEMIEFTEALIQKGYAYETGGGVYFDIGKYEGYGKLSRMGFEEQLAGARVGVDGEKRHPADFALWKKAPKEHIMQWQSPWGMGYPGWHIECSAMARKYLGDVFDIHTGGVDHIPIHHENEIAQSAAYTGKAPARFWMHGEFMLVDGGKMSKKLGNTYTLDDLEERGYAAAVFRFFCLNAHYRKKLNFTFEGMDAAKTAYGRLLTALAGHKNGGDGGAEAAGKYLAEFRAAAEDDLNIPLGLGILFTMLKEPESRAVYEAAMEMDKIFGLDLGKAASAPPETRETPAEVEALAAQRAAARTAKDFKRSDELRARIDVAGYTVLDTKEGYKLVKKQGTGAV